MNSPQDNYQAAYIEASEELKRINSEFAELSIRHERLTKVIEAIEPRLEFDPGQDTEDAALTTQLDDFKVITRLFVSFNISTK